jgi:hypothetical protein
VGNVDSWWDALVRDRSQAILELVLNAIADDYESLEIILKSINEWESENNSGSWAAMSAVPVSRPEVVKALRVLTAESYAQAYIFAAGEGSARPVDFHKEAVDDLWFYATPKGMQAVKHLHAQIDGID